MKLIRYCQIPTIEVTTPILRSPRSSVSPCSIYASRYPTCRPRSAVTRGRPGKPGVLQRLPHGPIAAAVAGSVDLGLGDAADVRPAAEEAAEMPFLIAPCRDLDRAADGRIGIDHARGFEGIDDAQRPVEPARVVLAFEMRPGQ